MTEKVDARASPQIYVQMTLDVTRHHTRGDDMSPETPHLSADLSAHITQLTSCTARLWRGQRAQRPTRLYLKRPHAPRDEKNYLDLTTGELSVSAEAEHHITPHLQEMERAIMSDPAIRAHVQLHHPHSPLLSDVTAPPAPQAPRPPAPQAPRPPAPQPPAPRPPAPPAPRPPAPRPPAPQAPRPPAPQAPQAPRPQAHQIADVKELLELHSAHYSDRGELWLLGVLTCITRQNLVVYGSAGAGKTSVLRGLARVMYDHTQTAQITMSEGQTEASINGSTDTQALIERGVYQRLEASISALRPLIMIDEIDKAPSELQDALLSLMESDDRRYVDALGQSVPALTEAVLAAANGELDSEPLQSRCLHVHVTPPAPARLMDVLVEQLINEAQGHGRTAPLPRVSPALVTYLRERMTAIMLQLGHDPMVQSVTDLLRSYPHLAGRPAKYLLRYMSAYSALDPARTALAPESILLARYLAPHPSEQESISRWCATHLAIGADITQHLDQMLRAPQHKPEELAQELAGSLFGSLS